ncbi:FAD-binding domain-containing protein [Aspergillus sclerotioniger CBS 115572]|uniref:FAD-binding domain-containing protein n=1 Tax=Aspergillus sclerotioniger CBS 115572 TaxID=1450535 RepID=A0A317WNI3_9EURO|nr:FAD-binding domain-containing protein [Aspergillus sclerotioniger CBS 115572]PWY85810.1 FAD-binding domain-containing protein [Aspergillus sclerotioniger CBS 115572]
MASYLLYVVGALGIWIALTQYSWQQPHATCLELSTLVEGKVFTPKTSTYKESLSSYFSFQERSLKPACIVRPTSAQDVSTIIKALATAHRKSGDKFAVRSNGQALFAGAANIHDGVTIDLRAMHGIRISEDRSTVEIESGAAWRQVFKELDPQNLTVTGGRAGAIGTGGYLLGGGLSILGPAVGWACDTVLAYEVVLASGEIVTVTKDTHRDLFLALKGGSNNFGVVTKFTMTTYPFHGLWGGFLVYPGDNIPGQLSAFSDFMAPGSFDAHADPILSFSWTSEYRVLMGANVLLYAKPEERPRSLRPFVDDVPALFSTLRTMSMLDFDNEEDSHQFPGMYTLYYTTTFAHSPTVYAPIISTFNKSIPLISSVPNMNWHLTLQPSPALKGTDNSLGLDPKDERLNVLMLIAFFPDPQHQHDVRQAAARVLDSIEEITKAAGVYRPFKYMGYADESQDVIGGYGKERKKNLQAASQNDSGIGSGLALTFHQRGYHVFATARDPTKMSSLRDLPNVTFLTLDVCQKAHIAAAVETVSDHTGKLDVLVNNAGRIHFMPILDDDLEAVRDLFETNVWGPLALTQAFAPLLIRARGTVVFMSSVSGSINVPYMGTFAASKGSLDLIAETLRLELSPFNVRVLTIVAGAVRSLGQTHFADFALPSGSLYKAVEGTVAARARGEDGVVREDQVTFCQRVVQEIMKGNGGRLWYGGSTGILRVLCAVLPQWMMDRVLSRGMGLDVLAAQNQG